MRIGIYAGGATERGLEAVIAAAAAAEADGFASLWVPQILGLDALTALAVAGGRVERIELGTAVVPTWPRHPVMLAGQALTTQQASGGRLTLGIGLSHQPVVEGMWGLSFDRPVRHMREYLQVLQACLNDKAVDFDGDVFTAHSFVTIPETPAPRLLIAALGDRMLEVCATHAEGTITWMTGPRTLESHTIPTLRAAADRHARGDMRVVVGLPVCVTDDEERTRARAHRIFAGYGDLPSYRAMLEREGVAGPADVAIVGSESAVRSKIEQLAEIGVTDFAASEFAKDPDERERTREVLRGLVRS